MSDRDKERRNELWHNLSDDLIEKTNIICEILDDNVDDMRTKKNLKEMIRLLTMMAADEGALKIIKKVEDTSYGGKKTKHDVIDDNYLSQTLNNANAATYLGVSAGMLRLSRHTGFLFKGVATPQFLKIGGGVRYRRNELDSWLDSHKQFSTTQEVLSSKKK